MRLVEEIAGEIPDLESLQNFLVLFPGVNIKPFYRVETIESVKHLRFKNKTLQANNFKDGIKILTLLFRNGLSNEPHKA